MRTWALHLQSYVVSGFWEDEALQRAIAACPDDTLRACLAALPSASGDTSAALAALDASGAAAEATCLRLALAATEAHDAQDPRLLTKKRRREVRARLTSLIGECRSHPMLRESQAMFLSLLGSFHLQLSAPKLALSALRQAKRLYAAMADVDPAHRDLVAMTLTNIGAALSDLSEFDSAAAAYRESCAIRREFIAKGNSAVRPQLARTLNHLAVLHCDRARYGEALDAWREALECYELLEADTPGACREEIAGIKNNVGALHRAVGDFAAAKEAWETAAETYRSLIEAGALIRLPDLATVLSNLGVLYSDIGAFAEARTANEEASRIYEALAEDDPRIWRRDLGAVLNNLGVMHQARRDLAKAQEAFAQAVEVHRKIAARGHAAERGELAATLMNFGEASRAARDFEAARAALDEACRIYRALHAAEPGMFLNPLGIALNNLGNLQSSIKRYADARATFEEARRLYDGLADSFGPEHLGNLATTLNNLGNLYSDMGDTAAARDAYERAAASHERLAASGTDSSRNRHAAALNNLGMLLATIRDYATAQRRLEQSLAIRRELAARDPETYRSDLASGLNNLGIFYRELRAFPQARAAYLEAAALRRQLFAADARAYGNDLATTLSNLGILYNDAAEFDRALSALAEALAIREPLAAADPMAYENELATVLTNIGAVHSRMERHDLSCVVDERACEIWGRLAAAEPGAFRPSHAVSLSNLGVSRDSAGNLQGAAAAFAAARSLFAALVEAEPAANSINFASLLSNLGMHHRRKGDRQAARCIDAEAVAIVEREKVAGQRHLGKGKCLASYRALLLAAAEAGDAARAFAFASALRDGARRSSDVGEADLLAIQTELSTATDRENGEVVLLVAELGPDASVTLGLIASREAHWWAIPARDWDDLLRFDPLRADHRARLALARRAWTELPPELTERLAATSEILICADSHYTAFPWELVGPGDAPLGLRFALPRCGSLRPDEIAHALRRTPLGIGGSDIGIIAPHATFEPQLVGVLREVAALRDRAAELGVDLVANRVTGAYASDGLMRLLIDARPAILYFSGHGAIVANEETLVLRAETGDGDGLAFFGRHQLDALSGERGGAHLFPQNPLVVLNCCHTGRIRGFGGQREDLVNAFLRHGAGAVIAAAMPILDAVGASLSKALFSDDTLKAPTIGKAIVEVRRQLAEGVCADPDQPAWGAWGMSHLHGSCFALHPFRG